VHFHFPASELLSPIDKLDCQLSYTPALESRRLERGLVRLKRAIVTSRLLKK